jgi:Spy/CpxP family protein refolding chaperone
MKRQLIKLAAVGSMAAGMIFAQAQAPAAQPNQGQHKAQAGHAEGAQAKGMRSRRFEGRRRMMQALSLTADQKAASKTIFGQAREASKPVRMEMKQNREAMAAAVKSDNKSQIEKLSGERGRLMAKLTANRTEAMAKFYQILTPAQKANADQMQARISARMHQLRGEHRGARGNG